MPVCLTILLKTDERKSMRREFDTFAVIALLVSLTLTAVARADSPATQPAANGNQPAANGNAPADEPDYVISAMRVQELKGMHYEFVSSKTSLQEIGDHVKQSMEKIGPAIKSGAVRPIGPALIIFHGVNQDPGSEFPLEVGFPIAEDAKAAEGYEVKDLDKFRCATVLFSGNMKDIRHAYEAVYSDLQNAGLEPTDEGRQAILMFEGEDSGNNVAMIEVGVH
jgi:effector-binding domain-containing protein